MCSGQGPGWCGPPPRSSIADSTLSVDVCHLTQVCPSCTVATSQRARTKSHTRAREMWQFAAFRPATASDTATGHGSGVPVAGIVGGLVATFTVVLAVIGVWYLRRRVCTRPMCVGVNFAFSRARSRAASSRGPQLRQHVSAARSPSAVSACSWGPRPSPAPPAGSPQRTTHRRMRCVFVLNAAGASGALSDCAALTQTAESDTDRALRTRLAVRTPRRPLPVSDLGDTELEGR
jgi:hypothetical protein